MGLGQSPPQGSSHSDTRVSVNLLKMDIRNKDEFIIFMQRATEDTSNDCYIELYNILLRAFISADKDFDGKVDEGEFEGMISAAAAFPQKFGFEFWVGSGKDQFAAIDENGDGAVSFDEWLGFAYSNYKEQSLATAFDKLDKDTFVRDCKNVGDTNSESYKKIYWFSWKCFQAADADRDGQVSAEEFGTMINVAGLLHQGNHWTCCCLTRRQISLNYIPPVSLCKLQCSHIQPPAQPLYKDDLSALLNQNCTKIVFSCCGIKYLP